MPEASPARPSKRMPRPRVALAAIACALLLGVTACSPADADGPEGSAAPPSAAAATDEPIFASDEEALAAAVEAYEAYAEMSWRIVADGGAESDRIRALVSEELAEQFVEEFDALADAGIRSNGNARVYGARLAERSDGGRLEQISAYMCQDVSEVRLFNATGTDVTPPEREPVSAILVRFQSDEPGSSQLVLEDVDKWDDDSFCV